MCVAMCTLVRVQKPLAHAARTRSARVAHAKADIVAPRRA